MKVFQDNIQKKGGINLDSYDLKILSYLTQNTRLPHNKLAKLLSLSRQNIGYRIKKLEDKQILVGSRTIINAELLGFHKYHYFLNAKNRNDHLLIIDRCVNHPNANAVFSFSGKWSLEISIMATSLYKCQDVFSEITRELILSDYAQFTINNTLTNKTLPNVGEVTIPQTYVNDSSLQKDFSHATVSYRATQLDIRILQILAENAHISFTEVGKRLSVSHDTVRYRVKKLIHSKHILAFIPRLDLEKLGYTISVIPMRIQGMTDGFEKTFTAFLQQNQTVLWAASCLGNWNYTIYLVHKEVKDIHTFIESLREQFTEIVIEYDLLFGKTQYKYLYLAPAVLQ